MGTERSLLEAINHRAKVACVGQVAITSLTVVVLVLLQPSGDSNSGSGLLLAVFGFLGIVTGLVSLALFFRPWVVRLSPASYIAGQEVMRDAMESSSVQTRALPHLYFASVLTFAAAAMPALLGFVAAIVLDNYICAIPLALESLALWAIVYPRKGTWERRLAVWR